MCRLTRARYTRITWSGWHWRSWRLTSWWWIVVVRLVINRALASISKPATTRIHPRAKLEAGHRQYSPGFQDSNQRSKTGAGVYLGETCYEEDEGHDVHRLSLNRFQISINARWCTIHGRLPHPGNQASGHAGTCTTTTPRSKIGWLVGGRLSAESWVMGVHH